MRAIAIDEFEAPASLKDVPVPEVGAGEVLIRVRAAGVNPLDWKEIDGFLKDAVEHRFPVILGFDAAGTVERVGEGVSGFAAGDEVYGLLFKPVMGNGTYAEYVTAPESFLARKPSSLDFAQAAALPMPGLTALEAIEALDLGEGDTVLIVGATGGLGSYAVQMAARRGARVIATARPENEAFARELGAAEVVDHTKEDLVEAVRASHPDGIEAVADLVQGDGSAVMRNADLVREGGRFASTLYAADVDALAGRGITATNVSVSPDGQRLGQLADMVDAGELSVKLEKTFPLEEATRALEESRSGHVRGKIVLTVNG